MKKGEATREHIIKKSAEIFNQQGYSGTSLNDIIRLTGIQKGGIYRHFSNKDEIAIAAYDYASSVVGGHIDAAVQSKATACDQLLAYFEIYQNVTEHPPFIGGCPLLNTAIESDDGHPALRKQAQVGLEATLAALTKIIVEGIANGELRTDLNADALASFALSALEGGIMLSKLEGSNRHIQSNMAMFSAYLDQCCTK